MAFGIPAVIKGLFSSPIYLRKLLKALGGLQAIAVDLWHTKGVFLPSFVLGIWELW